MSSPLLSFGIEPERLVDAHDAEPRPGRGGLHRLRGRALVEKEAGVVLGNEDRAEEAHLRPLVIDLLGRLPGPGGRLLELLPARSRAAELDGVVRELLHALDGRREATRPKVWRSTGF
jgi:hypothetical protein